MGWPKGITKAQMDALSPEERKEVFRTGKLPEADVPRETISIESQESVAPPVDEPPVDAAADAAREAELDKLVAETQEIDLEKPETIPPNYFSGQVKRLEVHNLNPAFVYYWFNDDKGGMNIGAAVRSGWRFVDRKDVQLNAAATPRNNDLGSRVRQYVGGDENGRPMNAYLMRIPKKLWEYHQTGPGSREEYHRKLEAQILEGTIGAKAGEMRYSSARPYENSPTTLPSIKVGSQIARQRTQSS